MRDCDMSACELLPHKIFAQTTPRAQWINIPSYSTVRSVETYLCSQIYTQNVSQTHTHTHTNPHGPRKRSTIRRRGEKIRIFPNRAMHQAPNKQYCFKSLKQQINTLYTISIRHWFKRHHQNHELKCVPYSKNYSKAHIEWGAMIQ